RNINKDMPLDKYLSHKMGYFRRIDSDRSVAIITKELIERKKENDIKIRRRHFAQSFTNRDLNYDGYVTREETKELFPKTTEKDIDWLMKNDFDQDGKLSYVEALQPSLE